MVPGFAWEICAYFGFFSLFTYLGVVFLQNVVCDKLLSDDLKKKYNADWAVVTGGSSGIGRAMVEKLAKQGVNVVIAALDDKLLTGCFAGTTHFLHALLAPSYSLLCFLDMQKEFPSIEFRKVPVNLASGDPKTYMDPLIEATKDVHVQLVFNNAGFITTGFYSDVPLGRSMANYHWCVPTRFLSALASH
jgi:NAD(P)-dependent dehydrogenase (short-subunit alcohol dehydrogenase family)